MAQDIGTIFLNTKMIFNTKNQYMGTINPYLGINSILSFTPFTKNQTLRSLSAIYLIEITKKINNQWYPINKYKNKKADSWRIKAVPYINNQTAKFTFLEFNYELLGLEYIGNWICEKYELDKRQPTFNIFFSDGKPGIEDQDRPSLFKVKYLVEDRIKYAQIENPELENKIFGGNILSYINNIKNNKLVDKNKISNKNDKQIWLKEVNKLVKKYNL